MAAALAWLKGHSSQLGGDPTHIFLVGHSSGAFLVSLLSTDTGFLTSAGLSTANVRCTASLDTEYDIASQIAQGGSQEALYRNAFGNAPATWAVGSPMKHTNPEKVRPKFLVVTRGLARARGHQGDPAAHDLPPLLRLTFFLDRRGRQVAG